MIAGFNNHFESLPYHEKRKFLIAQFPSWFPEGSFQCAGFFAWAQTQPAAIRNTWLQALEPSEVAAVIAQLGIWSNVSALEQTQDKNTIHAFLEEMLPFWHENGKFDAIGFDTWYQRAKFMDAEIVYKHLSPAEQKTLLYQWALQLKMARSTSISKTVTLANADNTTDRSYVKNMPSHF